MALKNLTDEEMMGLSAAWIDPKRQRPALEAHPLLAAMLPQIASAHDGLLWPADESADAALDAARKALYQQGVTLDQRHDRKGRGVFNLLGALADLTDDPDLAAGYLALRKALFPTENLSVLSQSWRGEAGNAHRIQDSVLGDKTHAAALKALVLPEKRTLHDSVRDFALAGIELGKVEDKRANLTSGDEVEGSSAVATRNRWITVGNNLVRMVDEVLGLTGESRRAILGALEESERKASARSLTSRPSETPKDPTRPT